MADSVGSSVFPRTGIQEGHLHFNKDANTLHVYNGGDPANIANWGDVPIGGGGGSVLRMPYKFTGTELSIGFGFNGEAYFIAPAAGTITRWSIIIGSVSLTENAEMRLYFDPFVAFTLVDTVSIGAATNNAKFERTVSQAVVVGDVLLIQHANTLNPAAHSIKISGYIDFTPS